MIEIRSTKQTLHLPSSWEDISPEQYLKVVELLSVLLEGIINVFDFRFQLLKYFTGYKPRKRKLYSEQECDTMYGNLTLLAEKVSFPIKLEGKVYTPNLNFKRNPIPILRIGRRVFTGATFNLDLLVSTNISAKRFCDAHDILMAYSETKHEPLLNTLCAILYGDYSEYSLEVVYLQTKRYFSHLGASQKMGVYYWFRSVVDWFFTHPAYSVLFSKPSDDDNDKRINLGMKESIMQLSTSGFGGLLELSNISVTEFFDLMVKDMKRYVHEALASGVKKDDIIKKIGFERYNALV